MPLSSKLRKLVEATADDDTDADLANERFSAAARSGQGCGRERENEDRSRTGRGRPERAGTATLGLESGVRRWIQPPPHSPALICIGCAPLIHINRFAQPSLRHSELSLLQVTCVRPWPPTGASHIRNTPLRAVQRSTSRRLSSARIRDDGAGLSHCHLGRQGADRARCRLHHHRRPAKARGGVVASAAPGGQ